MFLLSLNQNHLSAEQYESAALDYINSRRSEAPRSTLRRISSIRIFAKWAWGIVVLDGYIAPDPGEPIPHPLDEGMDGIYAMLRVAKNDNWYALCALQGFFALRVSEAINVQVAHLNTREQTLRVRGKGDKTRVLPYSDATARLLAPTYDLIGNWPSARLCQLSNSAARNAIRRMGQLAGISRVVSSHDLRATCLTDLYERTKDIRMVQAFAGHASITQTQTYIRVNRDAMRDAVNFTPTLQVIA